MTIRDQQRLPNKISTGVTTRTREAIGPRKRFFVMLAPLLMTGACVIPPAPPPNSITVTTTADTVNPTDGVLSLREAFAEANSHVGSDVIVLQAGATYTPVLGCAGTATEQANATGSWDHTDVVNSLGINGNNATLTGCAPGGTLADDILSDQGTGLFLNRVQLADSPNAAIRRSGSGAVIVLDSSVTGSGTAVANQPAAGIAATAATTSIVLLRSHVDNNEGPGIALPASPTTAVTLTDSSVSGNWQGIASAAVGSISLTNSHVDDNVSPATTAPLAGALWAAAITLTDSTANRNGGQAAVKADDATITRSHIDGTLYAYTSTSGRNSALIAVQADLTDSFIDDNLSRAITVAATPARHGRLALNRSSVRRNYEALRIIPIDQTIPSTVQTSIIDSHLDDNAAMAIYAGVNGAPGLPKALAPISLIRSTIERNGLVGGVGAIWMDGDLLVEDSAIDGNAGSFCVDCGTITVRVGGVVIRRSSISNNTASIGSPGALAAGFPTDLDQPVPVLIEDSTISGNVGRAPAVSVVLRSVVLRNSTITGNVGGGIAGAYPNIGVPSSAVGRITVERSTIVDNAGPAGTGVEVRATVELTVDRSVIGRTTATPTMACLSPSIVSLGYSVGSDATCGLTAVGDLANIGDPLLAPLAHNGGGTPTRLPLTGSLLIDRMPIGLVGCDGFDQRGVSRPIGFGCDAGAVEAPA